jgi:hypothetical protein
VIVPDHSGAGSLEQMIWSDPDSCEILGLDLRPGTALSLTTHQSAAPNGTPRATVGVDFDPTLEPQHRASPATVIAQLLSSPALTFEYWPAGARSRPLSGLPQQLIDRSWAIAQVW